MKRTVCVALLTWLVVVVASVFVFAAEEEIIPIIDRLPEEILIFGASGGAIVSFGRVPASGVNWVPAR